MIFISNNSWLIYVVDIGILFVMGMIGFLAARRWGRKAWPLLLCSMLLVPVLAYAITFITLYYLDMTFGLAGGFVVHRNWLILIVLLPTIIGAISGSASHQRRPNGS